MFAGHCFCSIPGIGLYLCPDFKYFHTKHQHPLGLHNGFDHALGEPCLPVSGVLDIEKERSRTCTSKRVDKIREIHGRLRAFVAMWMRCGSARCLDMHCELKLSYIPQPSFVWICIFKPHWLHAQEHPKLLCYYLGSTTCTRIRQNVISHYSHIFQICTIRACLGGFAWATSCQGLRGWLRLCDGMLNQSCRFFGVSRTTTQLSGQETRRLPWENSWMNQRFFFGCKETPWHGALERCWILDDTRGGGTREMVIVFGGQEKSAPVLLQSGCQMLSDQTLNNKCRNKDEHV